jgi:hypothetical protein
MNESGWCPCKDAQERSTCVGPLDRLALFSGGPGFSTELEGNNSESRRQGKTGLRIAMHPAEPQRARDQDHGHWRGENRREKLMDEIHRVSDALYYQPTEVDLRWASETLRVIQDGGAIVFPSTSIVYRVNHADRRLTLVNPEVLHDDDSLATHRRSVDVFAAVGYTVGMQEVN